MRARVGARVVGLGLGPWGKRVGGLWWGSRWGQGACEGWGHRVSLGLAWAGAGCVGLSTSRTFQHGLTMIGGGGGDGGGGGGGQCFWGMARSRLPSRSYLQGKGTQPGRI